jgi:hypothetical protein
MHSRQFSLWILIRLLRWRVPGVQPAVFIVQERSAVFFGHGLVHESQLMPGLTVSDQADSCPPGFDAKSSEHCQMAMALANERTTELESERAAMQILFSRAV